MSDKYATQVVRGLVAWATAGTPDNMYVCHGMPGEWELVNSYWVPDAAITGDATNYATLTAKAGATAIASYAFTAGNDVAEGAALQIAVDDANSARTFGPSDVVTLAKTVAASGLALAGNWVLVWKRVPADSMYV